MRHGWTRIKTALFRCPEDTVSKRHWIPAQKRCRNDESGSPASFHGFRVYQGDMKSCCEKKLLSKNHRNRHLFLIALNEDFAIGTALTQRLLNFLDGFYGRAVDREDNVSFAQIAFGCGGAG